MPKPNNLLEMDVRDELEWDPILNPARIVVEADDGTVTLSGAVDTYDHRLLAERDAWVVGGVRDVKNDLLVGLVGEAAEDAVVAKNSAIALDSTNAVPAGSVTASVLDGWITLSGRVRRHYQRRAAERAVGRVDGVLGITDNVAINAEPIPSDVAARITKALRRNALVGDSEIEVTNVGSTIYLDGMASSYAARLAAEDAAWAAPGVADVFDRTMILA
jgi:osmotically-inducible protein OsmY